MKNYLIYTVFHGAPGHAGPAVANLSTHTTGPDLELLLRALNASPIVAAFSVYSTPVAPEPTKLGKLTGQDLGIDLEKLK